MGFYSRWFALDEWEFRPLSAVGDWDHGLQVSDISIFGVEMRMCRQTQLDDAGGHNG